MLFVFCCVFDVGVLFCFVLFFLTGTTLDHKRCHVGSFGGLFGGHLGALWVYFTYTFQLYGIELKSGDLMCSLGPFLGCFGVDFGPKRPRDGHTKGTPKHECRAHQGHTKTCFVFLVFLRFVFF